MQLFIRPYQSTDTFPLMTLFYETIHTVNLRDYTQEQVAAWAPLPPEQMDFAAWAESLGRRTTFVAESDAGMVVGFGELEEDGHINRFYCHKDYQGVGVGTALLAVIEATAREWQLTRLFTEASITAKPFFERRGFSVLAQQSVERFGIALTNYRMEKTLSQAPSDE